MARNRISDLYDQLAAQFRADPTAVLRINGTEHGIHNPTTVRQAMRTRGIYVKVGAKSQDRPFLTLELDDRIGEAIDPIAPVHQQQQLAGAAERKAFRAHVRSQGLNPDEMGIGDPTDDA